MKHLPKWLERSLSRPKKDASEHQPTNHPTNTRNANPDDSDLGVDLPKDLQDFLVDVPLPDIYSDAAEATVPDIKTLDSDEPGGDKETGFNPYNTVRMHKK